MFKSQISTHIVKYHCHAYCDRIMIIQYCYYLQGNKKQIYVQKCWQIAESTHYELYSGTLP